MERHAYLIQAHKFDYTFKTLLKMIDDTRNDIFIHMDKKNKKFNEEEVKKIIKKSNVFFTERTSVTWGAYSIINSELLLLKKATSTGKYMYYHLLSGEDLPIKNQDYIHNFFQKNIGKEFVRFEKKEFTYSDRIRYTYPFQELAGRSKNIYRILGILLIKFQKIINYSKPIYKNIRFQKGTNWFSITDSLARYVVEKENWIKETFKNSFCSDEIFLQTIVINSDYIKNLYHKDFDNNPVAIMRLIDWKRGNPYIFKKDDLDELKKSEMLFARKFNCKVDKNIIDKVYDNFK